MTDDLELKIYKNYRAALRSYRSTSRRPRAAAIRQNARAVTVKRYGIPWAEVKRIVAKQDMIHGIEHDYSTRAHHKAVLDALKAFEESPSRCAECGGDEEVRVRALFRGTSPTGEIRILCLPCTFKAWDRER